MGRPIGKSGKAWRKVTDGEVAEWRRMVEVENLTLREVGRRTGRDHATIRYHVTARAKIITKTPEERRAYREHYRRGLNGRLYGMLQMARRRCRLKGIDFDLTVPDLTAIYEAQGRRCALTGLPFDESGPNGFRTNPYSPSIDKIDSSKGYVRRNVRIVLWAVNCGLGQWGEEVFAAVARAYVARYGMGG